MKNQNSSNAARAMLRDVREFARHPYAWPGGYPRALLVDDGSCICHACTRAEYRQISCATRHGLSDGWRAVSVGVLWEGPDEQCGHCGKWMPTAYGDPDDDNDTPA